MFASATPNYFNQTLLTSSSPSYSSHSPYSSTSLPLAKAFSALPPLQHATISSTTSAVLSAQPSSSFYPNGYNTFPSSAGGARPILLTYRAYFQALPHFYQPTLDCLAANSRTHHGLLLRCHTHMQTILPSRHRTERPSTLTSPTPTKKVAPPCNNA